ncbi:MAG: transcription termination/antitermination protein NusG [Armatimonadetes bacterium]|nr:transcription termination/antitermination protein NusG [Armatimonadota bacterium]
MPRTKKVKTETIPSEPIEETVEEEVEEHLEHPEAASPGEGTEETEEDEEFKSPDVPNKFWYVIHTYAGYENKVRANLLKRIESMGMKDKIFQVIVPTEEEIEIRDGKRRTVQKKLYPGYVLVEMVMEDSSWYVVRNTSGVTGFLGPSGSKPIPLDEKELKGIMKKMRTEAPKMRISIQKGEKVKVNSGPFSEFYGIVQEVNAEREKVKVLISIFGRETPVELDYIQVEKL